MGLNYHPERGTILVCDFEGFKEPEMVKRRPVVVLSPRFRNRDQLCTIVPLSTTTPRPVCAYHSRIIIDPPLPFPYDSPDVWIKGDMLCAVAFSRLSIPFDGKDLSGKRRNVVHVLAAESMRTVDVCVLNGLGFGTLTPHL